METPVLLIIFNRPDKVKRLIGALEKVKPTKLYVSADGPRANVNTDIKKCQDARELFYNLPWECEVFTNYSSVNLGCKAGPVAGIDWFFQNVEEGIILEDDCIPDPTFFNFCSELLEYYSDDMRVMHISGNNFQDGIVRGEGSYYFSLYTHSWGWATWRRAWQKYHPALEEFTSFDKENKIIKLPISKAARNFWIKNFRQTINGNDSWDSLWQYAVWVNNGFSILPNQNLVSNIGFDENATHTKNKSSVSSLDTKPLDNLTHLKNIIPNYEADEYTFKKLFYNPIWKIIVNRLILRI